MVFDFWRCVIHSDASCARDILAVVVLQGGSSLLSRLGSLGALPVSSKSYRAWQLPCWARLALCFAWEAMLFVSAEPLSTRGLPVGR